MDSHSGWRAWGWVPGVLMGNTDWCVPNPSTLAVAFLYSPLTSKGRAVEAARCLKHFQMRPAQLNVTAQWHRGVTCFSLGEKKY